MHAQARPARGVRNGCAGFHKDFNQALAQRLLVDGLCRRNNNHAHMVGNAPPTQDVRRNAQVADAPIRATAQVGLVNANAPRVADGVPIAGAVGERHHRFQLAQVDLDAFGVVGVGVGFKDAPALFGRPFFAQVGLRHVVGGDNARHAAGFHRHVGQGEALFHGERRYTGTAPLHRHGARAVVANPADDFEDDVFGIDARLQLAHQVNTQGFRHFQPEGAGVNRARQVG